MILRICHCSHDISSHFEGKHTCLGMLCDCTSFRNRDVPLPKPLPRVKATPMPAPDDVDPITHPTGCLCSVCAYRWGTP